MHGTSEVRIRSSVWVYNQISCADTYIHTHPCGTHTCARAHTQIKLCGLCLKLVVFNWSCSKLNSSSCLVHVAFDWVIKLLLVLYFLLFTLLYSCYFFCDVSFPCFTMIFLCSMIVSCWSATNVLMIRSIIEYLKC